MTTPAPTDPPSTTAPNTTIVAGGRNTTLYETVEDTTPSQILLFFSVALAVAFIAKIIVAITRFYIEHNATKTKKKQEDEEKVDEGPPVVKIPLNKKLSTAGGSLFNMMSIAATPGSPEIGKKMWEQSMSIENIYAAQRADIAAEAESIIELPGTSSAPESRYIVVQPRPKPDLTFENEDAVKSNVTGEEIRLVQPAKRPPKVA